MLKNSLDRCQTLKLLPNSSLSDGFKGNFLCFLMIPIIERFRQWGFAGTASNLTEAFNQIENLIILLGGIQSSQKRLLEEMGMEEDPEFVRSLEDSWSMPGEISERKLETVNLIVYAEGKALYDHSGFFILEIPSFQGHPYAE